MWKKFIALWSYIFWRPICDMAKLNIGKRSTQDRSIDFSETVSESLLDIFSDAILQLLFKKPPLVKSWVLSKKNGLKRLLKYCSIFQLYIWLKLDFFYILQKKPQHIATYWMLKQIWKFSCFLLSQTLKKFAKII